jgi:hypothetical protein
MKACIRCGDPLDVVAKCAKSITCSACSFEDGYMTDGEEPKNQERAA